MLYPIYFETRNGNKYIFDNSSRVVLSVNEYNIEDSHIDKVCLAEEIILNKIQKDYPRIPLFQERYIYEQQKRIIDNSENILKQSGIKQLILMITEECNFRCKYCIYSDMYSYSRSHSSKMMTWDIAQKAIDYYMGFNKKSLEYNPTHTPCIGFYGGEALLNWNLIVKVVEYVDNVYRKEFNNILYTVTTNGSLLSSEKIDFMLSHNFSLLISLDGYKENHNRNRVYISGKGTYDDVIKKISILTAEYEKRRHDSNFEFVYQFALTYDNEISIEKLIQSAENDPELYSHYLRMSKVRGINTDYYNNQLPDLILGTQINKWINKYINKETKNKIAEILYRQYVTAIALNIQFEQNMSGGTCMPGDKIAVSTMGQFYICEKIDYQSPLGDVDNGINFSLQKKYFREYLDARKNHCCNCNITNICNQCFSVCSCGNNDFYINKEMCNALKENIASLFSIYYTARENGIDVI